MTQSIIPQISRAIPTAVFVLAIGVPGGATGDYLGNRLRYDDHRGLLGPQKASYSTTYYPAPKAAQRASKASRMETTVEPTMIATTMTPVPLSIGRHG